MPKTFPPKPSPKPRRAIPAHPPRIRRLRARIRIVLGVVILLAALVGAAFGVTALPLFGASPFMHRATHAGSFLAIVCGWVALGAWAIWSGRRIVSEGSKP
jgi:hypothetical protein